MPDGQVLEFSRVTKRFGAVAAVSDFSARIEPGKVTGFLGPNGAGKTTSLRILLGLVRATDGSATIGGVPYAKLSRPLQTVGSVLEAASFHPGRSAANHLAVYARAAGIPRGRVDDVLGLVGLGDVAGRKVGGFSLGMRQRLGLAYALLGDPGVLVLDEPANGLDPEGIRWMRGLLRTLAQEGRTVLVSSHLLGEIQQTVDALIVIARGRLVFQGGIEDLADPNDDATLVDAPDRDALTAALDSAGLSFQVLRSGLAVRGAEPAQVGAVAAASGVALSALQRRGAGLEEIFLDLVSGVRVQSPAGGVVFAAVEPAPAAVPVAAEPVEAEPAEAAVAEPAVAEPTVAEPTAEAAPAATEAETVQSAPAEATPAETMESAPAETTESAPAETAESAPAEPVEAEPVAAEPEAGSGVEEAVDATPVAVEPIAPDATEPETPEPEAPTDDPPAEHDHATHDHEEEGR